MAPYKDKDIKIAKEVNNFSKYSWETLMMQNNHRRNQLFYK